MACNGVLTAIMASLCIICAPYMHNVCQTRHARIPHITADLHAAQGEEDYCDQC